MRTWRLVVGVTLLVAAMIGFGVYVLQSGLPEIRMWFTFGAVIAAETIVQWLVAPYLIVLARPKDGERLNIVKTRE
jgi:hypothetical protein